MSSLYGIGVSFRHLDNRALFKDILTIYNENEKNGTGDSADFFALSKLKDT